MNYTCSDYRLEMILLSLKRRLQDEKLNKKDYENLLKEIQKIEVEMGLK